MHPVRQGIHWSAHGAAQIHETCLHDLLCDFLELLWVFSDADGPDLGVFICHLKDVGERDLWPGYCNVRASLDFDEHSHEADS